MLFDSIMHVAFFAKDINKTIEFYKNLGCEIKMAIKYKSYINNPEHEYYNKALTNPEDYCIVYIEVAKGQFIELYPYECKLKDHVSFNEHVGFSHIGVVVDDIFEKRDYLVSKNINIIKEPKIGNSHTWQMWIADPDDNRIEIMQYTPESYQLIGHIDK